MALPHLYLLLRDLSDLPSPFPPGMVDLLPSSLALATLAGLWWFTRRLGLQRRLAWRLSGVGLSIFADGISRELLRGPGDWHPERLVIYPALLVLGLITAYLSDQIPHRIERLTGKPA